MPDLPEDLGPVEDALHIYNWADYIDPATVEAFATEFGVRVSYDTFDSNEEMLAKLQAGATGYDLVVTSGYILPPLVALGLVAPLAHRYLTNWNALDPRFTDTPFDPGNRFTMPWHWGVTGIAYRTDRLEAPTSWGVFHDAALAQRMTMLDDAREVLGAWLRHRGHSVNATDPDLLARAGRDALAAKPLLRAFKSIPVKGDLLAGDVWVAQLWDGDAAQVMREDPRLAFAVPDEGTAMWLDSFAVVASAAHKRAAHEFLNFCLRPEVAIANARATGYGSPQLAAQAALDAAPAFPADEVGLRYEYLLDVGEAVGRYDRLWTEIKAG